MRYVAVTLTADRRVDSTATQGTWHPIDENTVVVSWMLDSTPISMTIHVTSPQMTGEVETPTGMMQVGIARIECHP
jgi:hypothetical protein